MSVITRYEIENIFTDLEDKIKTLKILNDSLTFQIIISDSIELLSLLFQKIRNKKNHMEKNSH